MIRPGFVTGLVSEARLLKSLNAPVAVSGSDADTARERAEHLVQGGATALISFGLAGGLDPALAAGALIVPRGVVCDKTAFPCDTNLLTLLGGATVERIASAGSVVTDVAAKAALFQATAAAAVDLESGPVAHVAASHNLPFAALRAVADPANRRLPPVVSKAVMPDGRVAVTAIIGHLAMRPFSLADFIALARDAGAAQRTLRRHVSRLRMTGSESVRRQDRSPVR